MTAGEMDSIDEQRCHKCSVDNQYIIDPDVDSCQKCPPGLVCQGDATVQRVVENSTWIRHQAGSSQVFKLVSCPSGYRRVSTDGEWELQECEPCGKGEECTNATCITCAPCQPGYYKAAVSTDACLACPADRYRETAGASDLGLCRKCQLKSSTQGMRGQTSRRSCECDREYYLITSDEGLASESLLCQTCPKGARCADDECALRNEGFNCSDGSGIVGNWSKDDTGHYRLTSCPAGY